MRWTTTMFATMAALGLCAGSARADMTLRCPNGVLVAVGDDSAQVRASCGVPVSTSRRTLARVVVPHAGHRAWRLGQTVLYESVVVDEWRYDFGPDRLVRLLTFENGTLVRIRTRDYGLRAAPQ